MPFLEATVLYRESDRDPRDPTGLRSQKRLFNAESVALVTPATDGSGHTIFHMRQPSTPPFFVILEPYEYWSHILTADQPRPVGAVSPHG